MIEGKADTFIARKRVTYLDCDLRKYFQDKGIRFAATIILKRQHTGMYCYGVGLDG